MVLQPVSHLVSNSAYYTTRIYTGGRIRRCLFTLALDSRRAALATVAVVQEAPRVRRLRHGADLRRCVREGDQVAYLQGWSATLVVVLLFSSGSTTLSSTWSENSLPHGVLLTSVGCVESGVKGQQLPG